MRNSDVKVKKMTSEEKLWDICMEIYNKMYEEADPSADFGELLEKAKEGEIKPDFYQDYYLPNERQTQIVEEVIDDYSLNSKDKNRIKVEVLLGSAPIGSKDGENMRVGA